MPRPPLRGMDCCSGMGIDQDQQDAGAGAADADALFDTDNFKMYCFKILPCAKRQVHDWTVCPFAHPGEKARRRDPRVYSYLAIPCPEVKQNRPCKAGDNCPYAHSVFEYWLHPSRYRTQLCQHGTNCKRSICFFAHTPAGLRVPDASHLKLDDAANSSDSISSGSSATSNRSSSMNSSSSLQSSGSFTSSGMVMRTSSTSGSDAQCRRSSSGSGSSGNTSPDAARAAQYAHDQRARQHLALQHQQGLHMQQQHQQQQLVALQQEQQHALHQVQQLQQQQRLAAQQQQHAQSAAPHSGSPFHLSELLSVLPSVVVQPSSAPPLALPLSPNSCMSPNSIMLDEVVMPPLHHASPPLSPALARASPTSVLADAFNCAPVRPLLRPGLLPAAANTAPVSCTPSAAYGGAGVGLPEATMSSMGHANGCGAAAHVAGGLSMDDVAQLVSMAQQDNGAGGNQLLVGLVNVLVHQLQQQQVMV